MRRLLTALALVLAPVALAADVLLYTAPAGTVTRYRQTTTSTLTPSRLRATSADGSKVPESLLSSVRAGLKTYRSNSITESTETVLEVGADGTRLVETASTIRGAMVSPPGAPGRPLSFRYARAYLPDGRVDLRDFAYDTAGLEPGAARALEAGLEVGRAALAEQSASAGLYGRSYEPRLPSTTALDLRLPLALALPAESFDPPKLRATVTRTYLGRGPGGELLFRLETRGEPATLRASAGGLSVVNAVGAYTDVEGLSYLLDGRLSRASRRSAGTFAVSLTQPVGGRSVTVSYDLALVIESVTQRLP